MGWGEEGLQAGGLNVTGLDRERTEGWPDIVIWRKETGGFQ